MMELAVVILACLLGLVSLGALALAAVVACRANVRDANGRLMDMAWELHNKTLNAIDVRAQAEFRARRLQDELLERDAPDKPAEPALDLAAEDDAPEVIAKA